MADWVSGRVVSTRQWNDTHFSVSIDADVEDFHAGQFLRFGLDIHDERVGRPYSCVNSPHERPLEIFFNIVPDGPLSGRLAALNAGDNIWVTKKGSGLLTVEQVPKHVKHLWLFSTGTAVGPFLSILKTVKAWIPIDGPFDIHERAPRISPQQWNEQYLYSRCMTCGCCMAACPQYGEKHDFIGPATLAQVQLMNQHPTGQYNRSERLHSIMGDGGLTDCGNAQNCVAVCPKEIPLTTAIGKLGRETTIQLIRDLFDAE